MTAIQQQKAAKAFAAKNIKPDSIGHNKRKKILL